MCVYLCVCYLEDSSDNKHRLVRDLWVLRPTIQLLPQLPASFGPSRASKDAPGVWPLQVQINQHVLKATGTWPTWNLMSYQYCFSKSLPEAAFHVSVNAQTSCQRSWWSCLFQFSIAFIFSWKLTDLYLTHHDRLGQAVVRGTDAAKGSSEQPSLSGGQWGGGQGHIIQLRAAFPERPVDQRPLPLKGLLLTRLWGEEEQEAVSCSKRTAVTCVMLKSSERQCKKTKTKQSLCDGMWLTCSSINHFSY